MFYKVKLKTYCARLKMQIERLIKSLVVLNVTKQVQDLITPMLADDMTVSLYWYSFLFSLLYLFVLFVIWEWAQPLLLHIYKYDFVWRYFCVCEMSAHHKVSDLTFIVNLLSVFLTHSLTHSASTIKQHVSKVNSGKQGRRRVFYSSKIDGDLCLLKIFTFCSTGLTKCLADCK